MGSHSKDGGLFQSVHDLFWQQGSGERREGPRHPYECKQLMAPYDGVRLPGQAEFGWVECRNISSRGLSFVLPEPPEFQHVIMALGSVPFIFLVAGIVYSDVEGEHYICGCRFQKRITRALGQEGPEAKQLPADLNRSLLDRAVKEARLPGARSGAARTNGRPKPAEGAAPPPAIDF